MGLSSNLISKFVKATAVPATKKTNKTLAGTVKIVDDAKFVKLDGSELMTPVSSQANVKDGERVDVQIENHQAKVVGSTTDPSASMTDKVELDGKIAAVGELVADKVSTEQLNAVKADVSTLQADNVTINNSLKATNADVSTLQADNVTINNSLKATNGNITNLQSDVADITALKADTAFVNNLNAKYATVSSLQADEGRIGTLETNSLTAESAVIKNLGTTYANIDFANIKEAGLQKIFAKTGLISDLVVTDDTTIAGKLSAVTIDGDLINANTLKANKLIIKGSDGLFHKLNVDDQGNPKTSTLTEEQIDNGLDGTNIIAKTLTADKVTVSDLNAFGATIGGFGISQNSINSVTKTTIDSTTKGVYLDNSGQVNFGDSSNYIKGYTGSDNAYHVDIKAKTITLGSGQTVETAISSAASTAQSNAISSANSHADSVASTAQANAISSANANTTTAISNIKVRTRFSAEADDVNISGGTVNIKSGGALNISGGIFALDSTNFKVDTTGKVTATSGKIGGWTIDPEYLHNGSGTSYTALNTSTTNNGDYVFWSGSETASRSPFRIFKDGSFISSGTHKYISNDMIHTIGMTIDTKEKIINGSGEYNGVSSRFSLDAEKGLYFESENSATGSNDRASRLQSNGLSLSIYGTEKMVVYYDAGGNLLFSGHASSAGDAYTVDGLHANTTGVNNVANQLVRTEGNGYIMAGYINSSYGGNEKNAFNPPYVWGTNGSDTFLRTYSTSSLNVNYANSSGAVNKNVISIADSTISVTSGSATAYGAKEYNFGGFSVIGFTLKPTAAPVVNTTIKINFSGKNWIPYAGLGQVFYGTQRASALAISATTIQVNFTVASSANLGMSAWVFVLNA